MKKTVLGIITIVMLVATMFSTSVKAASLSVDKTEIKKGEIVTVTIKADENVESMQFDLKFNTAKYKFVEDYSIKTDLRTLDYNIKENSELKEAVLTVSAFDTSITTDTLTLQFEALEDGEKVPFEISNTEFSNDEVMENTTVEVTIAEEQEPEKPVEPDKPVNPDKPVEPEQEKPSEDDKKPNIGNTKPSVDDEKPAENNNGDKYVDEDGNEITKLPQAGSIAPSIVFGVALLGLATFVGYKIIKNK